MSELVQPAEAGFSTNLFLNHPNMGRVQFTFRGATSQDWGTVLEDLGRFLTYMKDKGWSFDAKPEAPAPEPVRVPMIDENGTPLVDQNQQPIMETIDGASVYTVKAVAHVKTQSGKEALAVFTTENEEWISRKYGMKCFHAPEEYKDFKSWPLDAQYAPKDGARHVVVRPPSGDSKYPQIVSFRA